ncbi:hypothetical protein [Nocardioides stalactiti]|uniref:hypothetical protein n=1 Tax=Nocardioides stalactiti TaxID=2755356 RepID=UPI001603A4D1|nr:hypothetical protein [Nocardioides stalactiti]
MSDETASHYLRDLAPLLLELAQTAQHQADRSDDDFDRGRVMGLYEAISLLIQQADAFGMSSREVGLAGVGFVIGPEL